MNYGHPDNEILFNTKKEMSFPVASAVKNLPAMQETQKTWVWSLSQNDPLEESMATHSNIPAWKIPWTERSLAGYSPGATKTQLHDWSDWEQQNINPWKDMMET